MRNAVAASWHRLRHPDDGGCSLCSLTRGVRGENPRWRRYLDSLPEPVRALTRDRFRAEHAASSWRNIELPVILVESDGHLQTALTAAQIRRCSSVKELVDTLDQALKNNRGRAGRTR